MSMTIVEAYKACMADSNLVAVLDGEEFEFRLDQYANNFFLKKLNDKNDFRYDTANEKYFLGNWEVKRKNKFEIENCDFQRCYYCGRRNNKSNKRIAYYGSIRSTNICQDCLNDLKEALNKL